MRKTLKILFVFIFAFIVFSIGNIVEANTIQSISMDIFVNKNGDAQVTETWQCNVTQGTEVYHPYYNLGNSEIKDLTVREGNSKYTTLTKWKSSGTLESKANKCGINEISNGVELCWGISEYGSHTYTAKYTITNFVSETTDAQMIYWTLIPYEFSTSIGNIDIKIHTNFRIQDTIDVWGYGNYGGTAYVYNGDIEMQSNGELASDEYMTILVKFPLRTFKATNKLKHDFEYYYNMAEKGANKYIDTNVIGGIIFGIVVTTVFVFITKKALENINSKNKFGIDYGIEGKDIPKDVSYFRDIPCKKDIFRAYYIGYQYSIIEKETDILGAIILKWLKDGIIKIEEKESGTIFKKENTIIILKETNPEILAETKEKELFTMLYTASKDGYLESLEFEVWCKNSYSKILSWFDEIILDQEKKLVQEGIIRNKDITGKRIEYEATSRLKQEALELAGLKRYLNEYTLIKERKSIEVHLFEEYLIFAQILGIAEKVEKQFKDIYPDIIEQSNFTSYDYIRYINISSYNAISSAKEARNIEAISRAQKYSAGGGGFSSGGGGGGSFGGGGGGRWLPLIVKVFVKYLPKKGIKGII